MFGFWFGGPVRLFHDGTNSSFGDAVTSVAVPNWLVAVTVTDGCLAVSCQPKKCQVGFVIGYWAPGTIFIAGLQCRLAGPTTGTNPFGARELTSLMPLGTLKPFVIVAL